MDNIYSEFIGGELEDDSDCIYRGGSSEPEQPPLVDSYIRDRLAEILLLEKYKRETPDIFGERVNRAYNRMFYTGVDKTDIAEQLLQDTGLPEIFVTQCDLYDTRKTQYVLNAIKQNKRVSILPCGVIIADKLKLPVTDAPAPFPRIEGSIEIESADDPIARLDALQNLLKEEAQIAGKVKEIQQYYISQINDLNEKIKRLNSELK